MRWRARGQLRAQGERTAWTRKVGEEEGRAGGSMAQRASYTGFRGRERTDIPGCLQVLWCPGGHSSAPFGPRGQLLVPPEPNVAGAPFLHVCCHALGTWCAGPWHSAALPVQGRRQPQGYRAAANVVGCYTQQCGRLPGFLTPAIPVYCRRRSQVSRKSKMDKTGGEALNRWLKKGQWELASQERPPTFHHGCK